LPLAKARYLAGKKPADEMPAGQRGVKTKTDNGKRAANGKAHRERQRMTMQSPRRHDTGGG